MKGVCFEIELSGERCVEVISKAEQIKDGTNHFKDSITSNAYYRKTHHFKCVLNNNKDRSFISCDN